MLNSKVVCLYGSTWSGNCKCKCHEPGFLLHVVDEMLNNQGIMQLGRLSQSGVWSSIRHF